MAACNSPTPRPRPHRRSSPRPINAIVAQHPGVATTFMHDQRLLADRWRGEPERRRPIILTLDPWDERGKRARSRRRSSATLQRGRSRNIRDAIAFAFETPPIRASGTTGGFDMQVQDRGGLGIELTAAVAQRHRGDGASTRRLSDSTRRFRGNVPQLFVDIDRDKVKQLGIPLDAGVRHAADQPRKFLRQRLQRLRRDLQVRVQAEAPVPRRARGHPRLRRAGRQRRV